MHFDAYGIVMNIGERIDTRYGFLPRPSPPPTMWNIDSPLLSSKWWEPNVPSGALDGALAMMAGSPGS